MGQIDLHLLVAGPVVAAAAALLGLRWALQIMRHLRKVSIAATRGHGSRLVLPLLWGARSRPLYFGLVILLHLLLLTVPFGLPEHSFSLFSFPVATERPAVMGAIALVVFGLIRLLSKGRKGGMSYSRLVLGTLALIPLASGYALLYTPPAAGWLADRLSLIHVAGALAFVVCAIFLTISVRLDRRTCNGCAACHQNCATEAIEARDEGAERVLSCEQDRCVRCGRCVAVCPEKALQLQHGFELPWAFLRNKVTEWNRVPMTRCVACGQATAPQPQIAALDKGGVISPILYLCSSCRERSIVDQVAALSAAPQKAACGTTGNRPLC